MIEIKTRTRTEQILTVMQILAWVAFIAYLAEAEVILMSYVVSLVNPESEWNLIYNRPNYFTLREFNVWYYTAFISFRLALALMKAIVWWLVIRILAKLSLVNPFTMEVAKKLEKISYVLLGTWIVGIESGVYAEWLLKTTGEKYGTWVSGEFLFMAGLVFVISQVFKRGVEIQSENELTV